MNFVRKICFQLSIMLLCVQVNASDYLIPGKVFDNMFNGDGFRTDYFIELLLNNKINIEDKATIAMLEYLPSKDLQIIRNTVYARHGYIFKNQEQIEYFKRKQWYTPRSFSVDLSQEEERIIATVKKIENCEGVNFKDFLNLFVPMKLPIKYNDKLQRTQINMMMLRKFTQDGKEQYFPYYAIGKLQKSHNFIVILYEMSSLETVPIIATFSLDGNLISSKDFFSIGGDLSAYTDGTITIDNDLIIHVYMTKTSTDDNGKEAIEKKRERYLIDVSGVIRKISK